MKILFIQPSNEPSNLNSESFVANAAPEKLAETRLALEKLLAQKGIYEAELLSLT